MSVIDPAGNRRAFRVLPTSPASGRACDVLAARHEGTVYHLEMDVDSSALTLLADELYLCRLHARELVAAMDEV